MDGGSDRTDGGDRHPVLQVFGIELQVSNPRLAELLTMDARDALTTDLHDLAAREQEPPVDGTVLHAVEAPPPTAADDEEARRRHAFRRDVHDIGVTLGFEVDTDGMWRSDGGVSILTRCVDRPVSFATATHYVEELASRREALGGTDATALFVVEGQQNADVFKVAVRQRRLHDVMRTVSIQNLREIRDLVASGHLRHRQAVVLLVPIANIDVGELLSILHAAAHEPGCPAA